MKRKGVKKPTAEGGLEETWCWYLYIPPAPVQTAHSPEAMLTRKSANGTIVPYLQQEGLIYNKPVGVKKPARGGLFIFFTTTSDTKESARLSGGSFPSACIAIQIPGKRSACCRSSGFQQSAPAETASRASR